MQPIKSKRASSENRVTFKTLGFSSGSAPSQTPVSLSHVPTMADSATFLATTTSHHDRFCLQCWLSPRSVVPNVGQFCGGRLDFPLLSPVLHRKLLPSQQMCYIYVPSHVYHAHTHTHTSCSFEPFDNPTDCLSMVQHEQETLADIL
jgi:hypothetical protein